MIPSKAAVCHHMNADLSLIWHTTSQESTAPSIFRFEVGETVVVAAGSLEHLEEGSATWPLTRLMRCGSMGPP